MQIPTNSPRAKPRVAVVFGGQSPEHAVSCVTAAGVLSALDTSEYDVIEIGITRDGQWTLPIDDPRAHTFDSGTQPQVARTDSTVQFHLAGGRPNGITPSLVEIDSFGRTRSLGSVDVVLPLLHGPYGEDGALQGLLEMVGVPYVGAGVLASAIGMDKHFMKLAFESAGLNVSPWRTTTSYEWDTHPDASANKIMELRLPVFVKPARGGSSVGISRVDSWSQLSEAIGHASLYDPKIVVEEGINGREIECGVLGGSPGSEPQASLLGEIVVDRESQSDAFYDFDAKYAKSSTADLRCPADLPLELSQEIRKQALSAFKAIDAEGLSRVDFFLTQDQQIIVNEINTMPGFTPISMYPQVWKSTGLTFRDLLSKLIYLALNRPIGLR